MTAIAIPLAICLLIALVARNAVKTHQQRDQDETC